MYIYTCVCLHDTHALSFFSRNKKNVNLLIPKYLGSTFDSVSFCIAYSICEMAIRVY